MRPNRKKNLWDEHFLSFSTSSQIIMSLYLACVPFKYSASIIVSRALVLVSSSEAKPHMWRAIFLSLCEIPIILLNWCSKREHLPVFPPTDSISLIEVFFIHISASPCLPLRVRRAHVSKFTSALSFSPAYGQKVL